MHYNLFRAQLHVRLELLLLGMFSVFLICFACLVARQAMVLGLTLTLIWDSNTINLMPQSIKERPKSHVLICPFMVVGISSSSSSSVGLVKN